jgi:uridine kinase
VPGTGTTAPGRPSAGEFWPAHTLAAIARLLPLSGNEPALAGERATTGRPVIIGIDGPSGAGKSTLASQLAAHLGSLAGQSPADAPHPAGPGILAMDQVYPGWDGLEAGSAILAAELLPRLASGHAAMYRRWDWLHHRFSRRRVLVPAAARLIVEGVGSCARRCAPFLTLQVWAEAPEEVRHARAMARDGETYRSHWDQWATQEQRHFQAESTRERADLHLGPG